MAQARLAFPEPLVELPNPTQLAYGRVAGEIPLDLSVGSFISLDREPPLKIYNLGFQPAKSIPEIARWFFNKYGRPNAIILDPFCGSGTTLIEALRFGARIRWLDYNPLSRLICTVKSNYYARSTITEELSRVLLNVNRARSAPQTISFANVGTDGTFPDTLSGKWSG